MSGLKTLFFTIVTTDAVFVLHIFMKEHRSITCVIVVFAVAVITRLASIILEVK